MTTNTRYKKDLWPTRLNKVRTSALEASDDFDEDENEDDEEFLYQSNPDNEWEIYLEKFGRMNSSRKLDSVIENLYEDEYVEKIIEQLDEYDYNCWMYLLESSKKDVICDVIEKYIEVTDGNSAVYAALENINLSADGLDSLLSMSVRKNKLSAFLGYLPDVLSEEFTNQIADTVVKSNYNESVGAHLPINYRLLVSIMYRSFENSYIDADEAEEYSTELLENINYASFHLTVPERLSTVAIISAYQQKFNFNLDDFNFNQAISKLNIR